jgi:outer membrane protein assembly factor BamD
MLRRIPVVVLLSVLALVTACTNKKVHNPLANVGSKQPDKVLFDRAMNALKHNRFDVARLTLQTLINTYPDSEFIARAKLGVADSWYAEGGTAALAQAEIEYNDFKTFFPNMPEAAEAQLKIANIHYQQMEKPDRDYTHALRAEQEYRNLIMQFPDSKLVPVAKQRLLEVQEVLAEREFRVGRFYYLRESYPAAIARLRSLVSDYPLYSKADEALYLLGQSYEAEIKIVRSRPIQEVAKARLIEDLTKDATAAYSRILTRYPLMTRSDDAKARLVALHQPVPRPTVAEVKQNKAEEDSRHETSMLTGILRGFSRHPNVADAAHVGEPTMVDPEPVSATEVVQQATQSMMGKPAAASTSGITVETVGSGSTPPPSEAAPRSDTSGNAPNPGTAPGGTAAAQSDTNELTPNVPADAGELKPNVPGDNSQALPPPTQVNEIQGGSTANAAGKSADQQPADDALISSSKHKKKKGLKKVIPF